MGGGGQQQSSNTSFPPWAVPFAGNLLGGVSKYVNQDLAGGYPPGLNWNVAPFSPFQQQGFGMGAAAANNPFATGGIDATLQNVEATQQGKFLDPSTNPWLAKTFDAAAQPVTQQFRDATQPGIAGMFAQSGSFGGSAQQQVEGDAQKNLGLTLDNLATGIYGGNYQQERANQLAQQQGLGGILGASYMPGQELLALGGQQQGQAQNILNTNTQNTQQQVQYPFEILGQLGQAIQQAVGGQGSTVVKSGGKGLFG